MATAKEEGDGSPVKNEAPEAKLLDRIAERDQVIRRLRESLERERATRAQLEAKYKAANEKVGTEMTTRHEKEARMPPKVSSQAERAS